MWGNFFALASLVNWNLLFIAAPVVLPSPFAAQFSTKRGFLGLRLQASWIASKHQREQPWYPRSGAPVSLELRETVRTCITEDCKNCKGEMKLYEQKNTVLSTHQAKGQCGHQIADTPEESYTCGGLSLSPVGTIIATGTEGSEISLVRWASWQIFSQCPSWPIRDAILPRMQL